MKKNNHFPFSTFWQIFSNFCKGHALIQINQVWSKRKRRHDLRKINNFYISSGTIKVKISENRNPVSITHTQDFVKYFPEVDLLPKS